MPYRSTLHAEGLANTMNTIKYASEKNTMEICQHGPLEKIRAIHLRFMLYGEITIQIYVTGAQLA